MVKDVPLSILNDEEHYSLFIAKGFPSCSQTGSQLFEWFVGRIVGGVGELRRNVIIVATSLGEIPCMSVSRVMEDEEWHNLLVQLTGSLAQSAKAGSDSIELNLLDTQPSVLLMQEIITPEQSQLLPLHQLISHALPSSPKLALEIVDLADRSAHYPIEKLPVQGDTGIEGVVDWLKGHSEVVQLAGKGGREEREGGGDGGCGWVCRGVGEEREAVCEGPYGCEECERLELVVFEGGRPLRESGGGGHPGGEESGMDAENVVKGC